MIEWADSDFGSTGTYTCEHCGGQHGVELMSPEENAVLAQIRNHGKARIMSSVPPYVAVAMLARLTECFANDHGVSVRDAVNRFQIEAAHGPLGRPSDN